MTQFSLDDSRCQRLGWGSESRHYRPNDMSNHCPRQRPYDPDPSPGLRFENFRKLCPNGFGDGHNSYAHTMTWFDGRIFVGTTRANMCMVKVFRDANYQFLKADWPVDCPDDIYQIDRRSQIWCFDPVAITWKEAFRAPMVEGLKGGLVAREMGYRGMTVFQGESDEKPALYVATTTPGQGPGPLILRSADGEEFVPASEYGILGLPITTVRTLIAFKGRLFTSPTGARGGKVNVSMVPVVYESRDPANGQWRPVSAPGFGDLSNGTVFEMEAFGDHLYAATINNNGFQIWRTDVEGNPPYRWEMVLGNGAHRGALNQAVASLKEFNGSLYVGTGIQGGGYDLTNKIGPGSSELLRINPDGSWDLLVGTARDTPDGKKIPLSTFPAGFGNFFNGYFWRMGVHREWLYLGTYDSSTMLPWISIEGAPPKVRGFLNSVGLQNIIDNEAGFDLWRSADGENWLPVHRRGFGNLYNFGVRTLVSTPYGLFVGTANPFGPRVAVRQGDDWKFEDNPNGGAEVWLGSNALDLQLGSISDGSAEPVHA